MNDVQVRNCQFAFKCPKNWEQLAPTFSASVRHCSTCAQEVFLCRTDKELAESIRLNRCVAVDLRAGGSTIARTLGVVDVEKTMFIDEESGKFF